MKDPNKGDPYNGAKIYSLKLSSNYKKLGGITHGFRMDGSIFKFMFWNVEANGPTPARFSCESRQIHKIGQAGLQHLHPPNSSCGAVLI